MGDPERVFDEVVTTTRSVRRRLDLQRPVDLETVRACLALALQAPTGGAVERWRWLIVTDPVKRAEIGELYRRSCQDRFRAALAAAPTEASKRAYSGALALAEALDRVPVLVFPCMLGEPPTKIGPAASAFYGSIFPAVWSFQLALHSRGLGSTLTTVHLSLADEFARLLQIPDGVSQIAMLPVAHTTGGAFRPAAREPVENVTYLDTWGAEVPDWRDG